MTPFAFDGRARNAIAAMMSAAAVLAIATYVTAPVAAKPAIIASYQPARHPMVMGMVKGDPRKARVTLSFRDAHVRVVAVRHPRVARNGAWRASIPRRAVTVLVVVRDDGHVIKAIERIAAGRSLHLTAVFAANRTGIVPGLFPY